MDEQKPKKKGFLEYFKEGFQPTQTRAQDAVNEERIKAGGKTQLEIDMEKTKEERVNKFKRGFFDRR